MVYRQPAVVGRGQVAVHTVAQHIRVSLHLGVEALALPEDYCIVRDFPRPAMVSAFGFVGLSVVLFVS